MNRVIALVFLGFLLISCTKDAPNSERSAGSSQSQLVKNPKTILQSARLIDAEGNEFYLTKFLGKKAVLLNFWATWCTPCIAEMPSIVRAHKKYKAKGFEVIAVAMEPKTKQAKMTLERLVGKVDFMVVGGLDSNFADKLGVNGIPHSILIDRMGNVRFSIMGEINWDLKKFHKAIEASL